MRNSVVILISFLLLLSSCVKSNEERAEALIQEELKSSLYHPETYKAISTQVDSAFINFDTWDKIMENSNELKDLLLKNDRYARDIESSQSSMNTYAPNGFYYDEYSRSRYNKYKNEITELQDKQKKINSKIDSIIREIRKLTQQFYSKEQTGWIIEHKFTSMNGANTVSLSGNVIFICDKDFKRCGSGIEKSDFERIFKFIKELSEVESDDDVKDLFEEQSFLF